MDYKEGRKGGRAQGCKGVNVQGHDGIKDVKIGTIEEDSSLRQTFASSGMASFGMTISFKQNTGGK